MMSQFGGSMLQIIRCWSGDVTGEEKIMTEDGAIWTTIDHLPIMGTGDRQGILFVDKVFER